MDGILFCSYEVLNTLNCVCETALSPNHAGKLPEQCAHSWTTVVTLHHTTVPAESLSLAICSRFVERLLDLPVRTDEARPT
jgi:hypothetical protein